MPELSPVRTRRDPLLYVIASLLLVLVAFEAWGIVSRLGRADELEAADSSYRWYVYNDDAENKNVMRQIFRQNEADRELLKEVYLNCR